MEKEIWKDVIGYEGLYAVSNMGQIISLNYNNTGNSKTLKQSSRSGRSVCLSKNGIKRSFPVHRLVASAFIENKENYKEVNHKDEDRTNNCVDNLEWCDRIYNNNYGTRNKRVSEKLGTPIICCNNNKIYASYHEAGKALNIPYQSIHKVCSGIMSQTHGLTFKFLEGE
jgi:hypothetical protein